MMIVILFQDCWDFSERMIHYYSNTVLLIITTKEYIIYCTPGI